MGEQFFTDFNDETLNTLPDFLEIFTVSGATVTAQVQDFSGTKKLAVTRSGGQGSYVGILFKDLVVEETETVEIVIELEKAFSSQGYYLVANKKEGPGVFTPYETYLGGISSDLLQLIEFSDNQQGAGVLGQTPGLNSFVFSANESHRIRLRLFANGDLRIGAWPSTASELAFNLTSSSGSLSPGGQIGFLCSLNNTYRITKLGYGTNGLPAPFNPKPDKPTEASLEYIGSNVAKVSWSSTFSKFNLQIREKYDAGNETLFKSLTEKSCIIPSLVSETEYEFRVQSVDDLHGSEWTDWVLFKTSASVTPVIFSDNFNRADTPALGAPWYVPAVVDMDGGPFYSDNADPAPWGIVSNQAAGDTSDYRIYFSVIDIDETEVSFIQSDFIENADFGFSSIIFLDENENGFMAGAYRQNSGIFNFHIYYFRAGKAETDYIWEGSFLPSSNVFTAFVSLNSSDIILQIADTVTGDLLLSKVLKRDKEGVVGKITKAGIVGDWTTGADNTFFYGLPEELEGSLTQAASFTGDLAQALLLSGALTQAAKLEATVSLLRELEGILAQGQAVSGTLQSLAPIAGQLEQAISVSGLLSLTEAAELTGQLSQGQFLSGALQGLRVLVGQLSQASALEGQLARLQALSASLEQGSALHATLTSLANLFLEGQLQQGVSVDGALQLPLGISGRVEQSASVFADLALVLRLEGQLAQGTQLAGVLNVLEAEELAGRLEQALGVSGGLSGAVGVAGRLDQFVAVVGALARGLSVSGRTMQGASFIGALSGVQGLSGAIYQNALLAGTLAGSASILGALEQGQFLSGFLSIDTAISLVGQVGQAAVLDGHLTGVANLGTNLEQDSRLEGWLGLAANLEGGLEQNSLLEGTIGGAALLAGLLVQSADLRAQLGADATVALFGGIQQASSLKGILQALRELEGRIEQGVDLRAQLEAAEELVARLEQEANFIASLGGLAELRSRLSQRVDLRAFLGRSRPLPVGHLSQRQQALALLGVQTLVEGSLRQRSRLVARLTAPSRVDTGYLTYSALYIENDLNSKVRIKKSLTYSSLSVVPALQAGRVFVAPESFKP